MRKLKDVIAQQERAEQDDRDLRSRSDVRKEKQEEADALITLAKQLSEMSDRQLGKLELSEDLLEVVLAARRISSPNARNRHMKVVRKVLRAERWEQLRDEVQEVLAPGRRAAATGSEVERWLKRLVDEGDNALEVFSQSHPHADRGQLRQLLRQFQRASEPQALRARKKLTACLEEALKAG